MREVYLTFKIEKKDLIITNFAEFDVFDSWEVLDKFSYDLITDSNETRLNYISKQIEKSNSNILICNAGYNLEDFERIAQNLEIQKIRINKIFLPNQIKRDKILAEGIELYNNHNRWFDFYPGQIEDIHNDSEERIKNIKIGFENTHTEIIEI